MIVLLEPKVLDQVIQYNLYDLSATKAVLYNLNSNIQNPSIPTLGLMPPRGIIDPQSYEFDKYFIHLLLSDDKYFINMMNVMIPLRDGLDVFVLIYNEPEVFAPINETIFKLIQRRYGYNYQLLDSIESFNIYDASGFTTVGIQNFDSDFERYQRLVMMYDPEFFTKEVINDEHL